MDEYLKSEASVTAPQFNAMKFWLDGGVHVGYTAPKKICFVEPTYIKEFKNSDYLIKRKDELVKKFYARKRFRNMSIKVGVITFAMLMMVALSVLCIYYIYVLLHATSSMLGVMFGVISLFVYVVLEDKLSDYFPTAGDDLYYKYRK